MFSTDSTVFIVDDEEPVRRALQSLMESSGHRVTTCASASEFLDAYHPSQPGCLILDVRMPDMDGTELQTYLVQHRIFLPVILLTGHGDVPMAVTAMVNGAFYFMQKPADVDMLVDKVVEALELDQQRRRDAAEHQEVQRMLTTLTPREREVLDHLVQGKPTAVISTALGSRDSTIRVQRATILKKMQADSVVDLLRMMSGQTENRTAGE